MLLLIAVICFLSAMSDFAMSNEMKRKEWNDERRHKEDMSQRERLSKARGKRRSGRKTSRYIAYDMYGNVIAAKEEVEEDG